MNEVFFANDRSMVSLLGSTENKLQPTPVPVVRPEPRALSNEQYHLDSFWTFALANIRWCDFPNFILFMHSTSRSHTFSNTQSRCIPLVMNAAVCDFSSYTNYQLTIYCNEHYNQIQIVTSSFSFLTPLR